MIHDMTRFCRSLWDWSLLDGCFGPTRIRPSDLDGVVERKGCLLVLEAKSPGVSVPAGQMRMLRALAHSGHVTVIVIWGHPQQPETLLWIDAHRTLGPVAADANLLRDWVSHWFQEAD